MLTTTVPESRFAVSISFSWPACRAPIVGTRPTLVCRSRASRTSLTLWTTRTYVLDVCAHCRKNIVGKMRVLLCEWRWIVRQTESIVTDEYLSVAMWSGADTDGRNLYARGDPPCKI